jgi:hypothetical protein
LGVSAPSSLVTTKTVLAAGAAAVLAYMMWAVCAPAEPESAIEPGMSPQPAAQRPDPPPELREPVDTAGRSAEDEETRPSDETQRIDNAAGTPPSGLERARMRLDRVTTKMRQARDDLSSLTDQERQTLFAEGMAAYDTMLAQANLAGPEAKAELEALYPEFRELMLAVKPPPPGGHEPEDDD